MSETLRTATELLQCALSNAISPEEFEQELWALSKGRRRVGRRHKSGDLRIYRTRVWNAPGRPGFVADLSYPPKHLTPLNRANLEGEPVFYASAGLPPSFAECRLQTGQHVVCAEWRNTSDSFLQEVGLLADGMRWTLSVSTMRFLDQPIRQCTNFLRALPAICYRVIPFQVCSTLRS
jgi:hypothetical protein